MQGRSISIAIRSRPERVTRVRLERSGRISPGTVSLRMVDGEMVVACSPTTIVEEAETNLRTGGGGGDAALMLREGNFEIALHAQESEVDEPQSEGPEATLTEATSEPGRVETTALDEDWRAD